jgi:hypothetical protein
MSSGATRLEPALDDRHDGRRLSTTLAVVLAATATLLLPAGAARADITTVVLKGDPSSLLGAPYRKIDKRPRVGGDVAGHAVLFSARVRGSSARGKGLFVEDPVLGGSVIALIGDPAPSGGPFRRIYDEAMNASGTVVWNATVGTTNRGIFRDGPAPVVLGGDGMPGGEGHIDKFGPPVVTDDGSVVFYSRVFGGEVQNGVRIVEGVFRCSGGDGNCNSGTGTAETLVINDEPVLDIPGRELCSIDPVVSASDWGIAFRGSTKIDCTSGVEYPLQGVFRMQYGGVVETLALQALASNPFPGPSGTSYEKFDLPPVIEDDGVVAFGARIDAFDGGVAGIDSQVIFRCDPAVCPATYAEVAVPQGLADGSGNTVSKLVALGINNDGDIAFHARVKASEGPNGRGIYVFRGATSALERIAVSGDAVPDAAPGTTFRKVLEPSMSSGGRISFQAKTKARSARAALGLFLFD